MSRGRHPSTEPSPARTTIPLRTGPARGTLTVLTGAITARVNLDGSVRSRESKCVNSAPEAENGWEDWGVAGANPTRTSEPSRSQVESAQAWWEPPRSRAPPAGQGRRDDTRLPRGRDQAWRVDVRVPVHRRPPRGRTVPDREGHALLRRQPPAWFPLVPLRLREAGRRLEDHG